MSAIFKRDLRAYFKSPLGYVYLAAFVLVLNIYFYLMNVYSGSSSLDGIFSFIVTMCVFLIPILTMRTFAEDYKQKTDQLLFTAPVRPDRHCAGQVLCRSGGVCHRHSHYPCLCGGDLLLGTAGGRNRHRQLCGDPCHRHGLYLHRRIHLFADPEPAGWPAWLPWRCFLACTSWTTPTAS